MESTAQSRGRGRVPTPARSKIDAAHASLMTKHGRPPTIGEIAKLIGVSYECARQAVMRRSAELGRDIPITAGATVLPGRKNLRGRRCQVGKVPAELGPVEALVVRNLQRVYANVIAQPNAPTDAQLAAKTGYTDRPDKAANEWRKYIEGQRVPSLERLGMIATALGVHVGELMRPL